MDSRTVSVDHGSQKHLKDPTPPDYVFFMQNHFHRIQLASAQANTFMTTIPRGERITKELDSKICKLQESCIQIENSMFSVCFRMPLAFSLVSQSRRTVHSKVARCCPTCRCAAGPPLVLFPVSSAAIAQQIDCVPIFPNQHVSPNFPTWCFEASPSLKSAFLKDMELSQLPACIELLPVS